MFKFIIHPHQSLIDIFTRRIEARMSLLSDQIATIQTNVTANGVALTTLGGKIGDAVTRIEAANTETAADQAALTTIADTVASNATAIAALDTQVDGLAPAPVPTPEPKPDQPPPV